MGYDIERERERARERLNGSIPLSKEAEQQRVGEREREAEQLERGGDGQTVPADPLDDPLLVLVQADGEGDPIAAPHTHPVHPHLRYTQLGGRSPGGPC